MAAGDEADLLEAGELVEEHAQHGLVRLLGQVGEEEDLVGGRVSEVTLCGHGGGLGGLLLGLLGGGAVCGLHGLGALGEGALELGDDVRVALGVVDAHRLVVEGEALSGEKKCFLQFVYVQENQSRKLLVLGEEETIQDQFAQNN